MKTIEASAPSNIALIKYMGKIRTESNLPTNASLSYTLENLRSFVTLESNDTGVDEWKPLAGFAEFKLSEVGLCKSTWSCKPPPGFGTRWGDGCLLCISSACHPT